MGMMTSVFSFLVLLTPAFKSVEKNLGDFSYAA